MSGSELVHKFIGEGAGLVRELFTLARERAPAIVFIDEIDAVGSMRTNDGTSGSAEVQRTLIRSSLRKWMALTIEGIYGSWLQQTGLTCSIQPSFAPADLTA